MMFGLPFGMLVEGAVSLLLAVTIAYCVVLNERLKRLHADRDALKVMVSDLIQATDLANAAVGELKASARLAKNPLKSAGFRVLKAPDVPSVLIELGYVTNKDDLKLITSDAWRARNAESIAQAINAFFSPRLAGAPAPGSN